MNNPSSPASLPVRVGAHFMLAWTLVVLPIQFQHAYAQGLPGESTTSVQRDFAVNNRTADQATNNTLINQRAQRLGSGWGATASDPVRTPNLAPNTVPIRTPNLSAGSADSSLATRNAATHPPLQVGDLVAGAQRSNDFAQTIYNKADVGSYALETERVEPGQNQTGAGKVNLTEVMPGYNSTDVELLKQQGGAMYAHPEKIKEMAEQNKQNLRRDGCRKTDFILLDRQDINQSAGSPKDRILKVEFFDLAKRIIPGSNPVEYETFYTPATYKRGTVKLQFATLGGKSSQWWDKVDDTFAIRYTYTPYTSPKGQNFFTYNHRLAVFNGGMQVMPSNYFASYGTPKNGFTPALSYTVPMGVSAVYLSADLYRTEVNYYDPAQGQGCPPDPPAICEVPSIGGDTLRWCSGSPGSGIQMMYDDATNPTAQGRGKRYSDMMMGNASSKDYKNDAGVVSGVMRGINAGSSAKAKELVGQCSRDSMSNIELKVNNSYHVENVNLCSETLVNSYPSGCNTIKRSFGMAHLGLHNYLTVRAFNKVAVPVLDPATGKQAKDANGNLVFTYRHDVANVNGSINTNFSIMGASVCSGGGGASCSTEILPDKTDGSSAGYYIEYDHSPLFGDSYAYAVNGLTVAGGSGSVSHFGRPSNNWLPSVSASGSGSTHELQINADIYSVTINQFAGCEKYMQYVADGFCEGGKLTCIDTSSTRSVGGVTFGPSLPNSGIVDILKKWGTESTAVFPDYAGGNSPDPTPTGPENILLNDKMCWEAIGESFTSCSTMGDVNALRQFTRNNEIWATDCHITSGPDGAPLETSASCKRASQYDGCDSRFMGLYTGVCYNPTLAYDCGTSKQSELSLIVEEKGDSCSGAMRCMGTECHRPNLAGTQSAEFAKAASGMEALNFMKMDMVCAETGEPPVNTTDQCTPLVFGGKTMYCKIPVGNEIGITPDCCKETLDAAYAGGPNWMDYLKGTYLVYKIGENKIMQQLLGTNDLYNSTSSMFGEIAKPVTDAYQSASQYVTETFVEPLTAGFDSIMQDFGMEEGVSMFGKDGVVNGLIAQLEQELLKHAYGLLQEILGDELASQIITQTAGSAGTTYALSGGAQMAVQAISTVFMVYSLARLIGHIVFACKPEEYEWGMNMKWKLCTYVGDCCSMKGLQGDCLEKRNLYCCYKSIAARVIANQIINKNLIPSRAYGYRTGVNNNKLKKCDINCGGFTPMDLAMVDWSQVDLSEWLDVMVESGLFTPADPRTDYGVSSNQVQITQTVGRTGDESGKLDQRIAAVKTVNGMSQNTSTLMNNTGLLRNEAHCYQIDEKMPYTYPECKATDCGNVLGSVSNQTTIFNWVEDKTTGDWILEYGAKQDDIYPDGSYDLSGTINIKDPKKLTKFILEWAAYDDWLNIQFNGHTLWNGPKGGEFVELCPDNRVRISSSDDPADGCSYSRELNGPHDVQKGGINVGVDALPFIQKGANELKVRLIVGGDGDFAARFRTHQDCTVETPTLPPKIPQ